MRQREGGQRERDWTHAAACVHTSILRRSTALDPDAGERPQGEGDDLPREADDAEQQGRAGQPVDQPSRRQPRHEAADQRHALAGDEEAEVRVPAAPAGGAASNRRLTGPPGPRSRGGAGHCFAKRLMISPAAKSVSRSGPSSRADGLGQPRPLGVAGRLLRGGHPWRSARCFTWRPSVGCGLRATMPISSSVATGGPHRLRPPCPGARAQVGGGGRAVLGQPREDGHLGPRQFVRRGRAPGGGGPAARRPWTKSATAASEVFRGMAIARAYAMTVNLAS